MAAEALSKEREQLRYRELADVYGVSAPRTVNELLAKLHDDKAADWSKVYTKDQDRFKKFWSGKLGGLTLMRVNAATVNQIAREESRRNEWAPRTHGSYLRYIVDAFYYAEKKLKWIDARHNLSAVDFPAPRSKGQEYSVEEIKALLPALESVDVRAGWIGQVAWQTGRRLSAIRQLRKRDVLSTEGRAVLRFPEETDKSRNASEAVVVGRAAELTARLMRKPGSFVLGKAAPTLDECEDWIKDAEDAAEIKHKDGRAWHGIKRAFVSAAEDLRLASKQSGTRRSTLEAVYDKDWSEGKETLASALAERAGVPGGVPKARKSADAPTS